ncbi:SAV_2336 N-terminal domain-related protein [Streptomyces subrutilus]|uniref:SAV_2336 N-terminal domain-related protein n=1 Tax=Streptomyces subrutilus TaxID=36818 RepID=UPI003417711A
MPPTDAPPPGGPRAVPPETPSEVPVGAPADAPPGAPGSDEPGLRRLVALLRAAGLDPSAGEVADALWLAARTGGRAPAGTVPREAAPPAPATGGRRTGAGEAAPGAAGPREEPERPAAEDAVTLYAPGARAAAGDGTEAEVPVEAAVRVRVPGAAALPRILEIQRALRALQRHRPAARPARTVLDEQATAEASARALGPVVPVFRADGRREATVRLVMDASPSMAVWQDMFEELRSVCERLGAFRDVRVCYLHRLADGGAALGRGPVPDAGLRSADQLRDPTGRALTMVVSDCAGPLWREGAAQRLLHRWAECTPCVVVQPLPQRLWSRSWLPTERGTLSRAGGDGRRLTFRPDRPPLPGRPAGGLAVPVLPPSATALGAWARLVAGLGTGRVPAEVGRVLAGHPAAPAPPPRAVRPPRELVGRFRSSAAPRAVQLAVYLSAAPLTLPVMRLVQRTMLPDSEPSDLAEVLLSGLLRRSGAGRAGEWYEFVPGVQDVLLGPLGRDEAALVLKHCSEYVLAHFGRGVRNFPALAVSQLTGAPVTEPDPGPGPSGTGTGGGGGEGEAGEAGGVPAGALAQAFAQVSAKVVRRYLPGPPGPPGAVLAEGPPGPGRARAVRAARERLAGGDGEARAVYEAVAVLRRAVALPPGPGDPPEEAETELAGALLRLWSVQRDPELLAEAERSVTGLRTAPARAALGRVLYERALAGARPDAELLAAADREFAAAGASAGGGEAGPAGELRRDCAVRRAEALMLLSELRDDPGPLHEARAALDLLTGPAPAPPSASRTAPSPAPGAGGDAGDGHGAGGGPGPDGAGTEEDGSGDGSGPGDGAVDEPGGGADEHAGGRPGWGGGVRYFGPELASGRVLLALSGRTSEPAGRAALAGEAAARLAWALGAPEAAAGRGGRGDRRRAGVRVELAGALRYLPARLEEAAGQLAAALAEGGGDAELRVAALVCLARVHRARYARDADPVALEDAAEAYGRARRLIPRDAEAFGELLPEWGDVLLDRAGAADGRRFTGTAVRVLRESRSAVAQSDPRTARRLVRLAAGLRLRHAYEGDPVDLREAEYLLELAVRHSRSPLERARAWRDHGDVQQKIHGHTRAVERLDRAADSYRRAWRAALEAAAGEDRDTAVPLAARVQELRGAVLERLARPRAALDAYRAALELWQRAGEDTGGPRPDAVRARIHALEALL